MHIATHLAALAGNATLYDSTAVLELLTELLEPYSVTRNPDFVALAEHVCAVVDASSRWRAQEHEASQLVVGREESLKTAQPPIRVLGTSRRSR